MRKMKSVTAPSKILARWWIVLGIGIFEILIIAVACLVVVGPKQMPMLIRKLAAFYRQFLLLREELRFQVLSADAVLKDEPEKDLNSHPQPSKAPKLVDGEK